jgi:hypothetical protein
VSALGTECLRLYFTTATMIAVINSVVGRAAVALALGVAVDASLGLAAGVGGAVAIASLLLMRGAEYRMHVTGGSRTKALFPSPPSGRDRT